MNAFLSVTLGRRTWVAFFCFWLISNILSVLLLKAALLLGKDVVLNTVFTALFDVFNIICLLVIWFFTSLWYFKGERYSTSAEAFAGGAVYGVELMLFWIIADYLWTRIGIFFNPYLFELPFFDMSFIAAVVLIALFSGALSNFVYYRRF